MKINNNLSQPLSLDELHELLKDAQTNKNKLIEHSLFKIVDVSKKYMSHGELDELCQIGTIGLIKALNSLENIEAERFYYHVKEYTHNEIETYLERKSKWYK